MFCLVGGLRSVLHLVGGRWSIFGLVGGFYGRCGRWSVSNVVGVLHFYWSVVGFYFREWSVVGVLISIWSVAHGLCSVADRWVGGFVLCHYTIKVLKELNPLMSISKLSSKFWTEL